MCRFVPQCAESALKVKKLRDPEKCEVSWKIPRKYQGLLGPWVSGVLQACFFRVPCLAISLAISAKSKTCLVPVPNAPEHQKWLKKSSEIGIIIIASRRALAQPAAVPTVISKDKNVLGGAD